MTFFTSRARRLAAAGAVAIVAVAAATIVAPGAEAAPPQILVSDDGVNFTPELTDGLFDGLGLLVPLESIDSSVWVKNTASVNGSLRLTVDEFVSSSPVFNQSVTLTAVSDGKTWSFTLAELKQCGDVVPTLPIAAGATVRIDLTASMADVNGQVGQDQNAQLAFTVSARDARLPFPSQPCALPGSAPTDTSDGDGSLSGTGADVVPAVAWSVGLIGVGLFMLLLKRRRDEEDAA